MKNKNGIACAILIAAGAATLAARPIFRFNTKFLATQEVSGLELLGLTTACFAYYGDLRAADNPQPSETKPASDVSTSDLSDPIRQLEADMVRIAGGEFTMGCQNAKREGFCFSTERPPHQVTVKDFMMGRYEVTQAQWREVMGGDPPKLHNKGCDQCPVEGVTWNEVQDFLDKLNALTGRSYRLPSEAEWEYAARGGALSSGYRYAGSNNIDEVAWYSRNYAAGNKNGTEKTTQPVGRKKPNELGLYDLSGNVSEWVADDWHGNYEGAPDNGEAWIDQPRSPYRLFRGGSWISDQHNCRVISRNISAPGERSYSLGFRLALSID